MSNSTVTPELITRLWAAFSEAGDKHYKAARSKKAHLELKIDRAAEALNAAQAQVRDSWARGRGWTHDPSLHFGHLPVVDHFEGFVDATGEPVGFVTHSYATREQIEAYGAAYGLNVEFLPWSWYAPPKAIAAVFTPTASSS